MISHYNIHKNKEEATTNWLKRSGNKSTEIILTSGASCPDAILDEVLQKIVSFYPGASAIDEALEPFRVESLI